MIHRRVKMNNEKLIRMKNKVAGLMVVVPTAVTLASTTCHADEATTLAMTTALTTVQTDALGAIAAVAPIGIGIMGAFLVWKYGLKFFKAIAK
jgi:hypothetical protein